MKALIQFAMVFEVEDEEEIAFIALAMRQRMYLDTVALLEEKGYSPEQIDSMQMYPPTYSMPLDFTEA